MEREKTTDAEVEARKEKKKFKEKRKKDEADRSPSLMEVSEDQMDKRVQVQKFAKNGGTNGKFGEGAKMKMKRKRELEGADSKNSDGQLMENGEKSSEDGDFTELNKVEVNKKKKKKKKKEEREKVTGELVQNITTDGKEAGAESEHSDGKLMENCGKSSEDRDVAELNKVEVNKKKRKRKKEEREKVTGELVQNITTDGKEAGAESEHSDGQLMENGRKSSENGDISKLDKVEADKKKKKKKKEKNIHDVSVEDGNKRKKGAKSKKGPDPSENSTPRKASKRVSFADDVVFAPSNGPEDAEKDLVQGKRFSKEEDKRIKEAVIAYIGEHQLGDEGVNMILNCKAHPEIKNCWKDIGAFLPWRPYKSVYYRAHILLERSKVRSWTPEEYEEVRRAAMEAKEKGESKPNWRKVGNELGKHRIHVKDAWRRIKLPNLKKGPWSQEEYQTLFDLVNKDLQMRALEEKKSKHGMLRDNIKWEAISETLGTRTNPICCQKWYNQLTSPLVADGVWADADDYRLIDALVSLDAFCIEDVDWGILLEHRDGDVCRKRWNQMVKHLGQNGTVSFSEQVGILAKRYCPNALEAREVYDSKTLVD